MINVKLFSYATCEELLNYKSEASSRDRYNGDTFDITGVKFINDSIALNLSHSDLALGTRPGDDLENSIKIYSALKDIDLVQANDKRLWVTLTHTLFFKYAQQRWSVTSLSSNEVIKDRFHFEGSGLRPRNQNSIARLWWAAKITHDVSRDDPFELTKILWEKQDFYQNLIDRRFSTYNGTLKGFLNFYCQNKNVDLKYEMRRLFKGINAYGGVRILSLLDEEEVLNQIYNLCRFYGIKTATA